MLDILYEDDSFLVVNKPPGIASVPGGWGRESSSRENLLQALTPRFGSLWIVHRLDRVTSGVILFARTAVSHRELSDLFESRLVVKIYHALVCGIPTWQEYTARYRLRGDVGHSHRTVIDHRRGKSAVTVFRLLERFNSHALLEAAPSTGRTHQVRAHAAALGHPILADTLYGAPTAETISRAALHAYSISFKLENRACSFTAPYPPDFQLALEALRAIR